MDEHSVKSTIKNDVKTTFLIANTFNALVGGLFPLSLGMAMMRAHNNKPPMDPAMAIGVPIAGVTSLGYYAAFKENKTMLNVYTALMGLAVVMQTLLVATDMIPLGFCDRQGYDFFFIFHIGITLASIASALCLSKKVPHVETPQARSNLAPCIKYVGYGVLVVVVVGFTVEYFEI